MSASAKRPNRGRLTRSADFDRVFRRGRSFSNRFLVVHAFPRSDEQTDGQTSLEESELDHRIGLSVSRKVGGSVERNLVKRLLRESSRVEFSDLAVSFDLVLVARRDILELSQKEGLNGVSPVLAELAEKLRVSTANSGKEGR